MFNKVYELPLSRGYVRHWGVVEAVRELLQNALDSDSPLEYNFDRAFGVLEIISRNSRLDPSTLLLGNTSKADSSDKIGQFGEGYKIALLVLARTNLRTLVFNNDVIWEPRFQQSKAFNSEVLCIEEERHPSGRGKGLMFQIKGLSYAEIDAIKSSCLLMQESLGQIIETSKGRILLDRPGMLYVKGLFVCETEMKYSYDVHPEWLKLERDRRTVSSFDLAWLAKEMWFESDRHSQIAELMEEGVPDLSYAQYGTPEVVKEACYQHFKKHNPGTVVAENKAELEALVEKGMKVYVSYGNSYTGAIRASRSYQKEVAPVYLTPSEELMKWFSQHRSQMRTPAIVGFKALLNAAKTWRLK